MHVNVSAAEGPEGPSVVIRAVNWGIRGSPLVENLGLNRRFSLDFATTLRWSPSVAGSARGGSGANGDCSELSTAGTGELICLKLMNARIASTCAVGMVCAECKGVGHAVAAALYAQDTGCTGAVALQTFQTFVHALRHQERKGVGSVREVRGGGVCAGILRGHCSLDVYAEVIGPFRLMPRVALEAGGNAVMAALVNSLLPLFLGRCSAAASLPSLPVSLPLILAHASLTQGTPGADHGHKLSGVLPWIMAAGPLRAGDSLA